MVGRELCQAVVAEDLEYGEKNSSHSLSLD